MGTESKFITKSGRWRLTAILKGPWTQQDYMGRTRFIPPGESRWARFWRWVRERFL